MAKNNDTPDNATTDPETPVEGQSFFNAALTGSGTITRDGEYTDPLPDPTQVRGLGPDRTAGGRKVLGVREQDTRYAELVEEKVGAPPDTSWGKDKGDAKDRTGTAKRADTDTSTRTRTGSGK